VAYTGRRAIARTALRYCAARRCARGVSDTDTAGLQWRIQADAPSRALRCTARRCARGVSDTDTGVLQWRIQADAPLYSCKPSFCQVLKEMHTKEN